MVSECGICGSEEDVRYSKYNQEWCCKSCRLIVVGKDPDNGDKEG